MKPKHLVLRPLLRSHIGKPNSLKPSWIQAPRPRTQLPFVTTMPPFGRLPFTELTKGPSYYTKRVYSSQMGALKDHEPLSSASEPGTNVTITNTNLKPFKLADIGEGISEVEVIQWYVTSGQHVQQFDNLLEVQSDKATVNISSRFDGVVRDIGYTPGDIAKVGSVLCYIEVVDAAQEQSLRNPMAPSETKTNTLEIKPDPSDKSQTYATGSKPLASPATRALAKEHQVDLSEVPGSGAEGKITNEDVFSFAAKQKTKHGSDVHGLAHLIQPSAHGMKPGDWIPAERQREPFIEQGVQSSSTETKPEQDKPKVQPIRGLMRAMVKTMTQSVAVPQLGLMDEVNMDELVKLKCGLAEALSKHGIKLTYLPIMIKACSMALEFFPILNASVDEACENIIYHDHHNISVAMDSPKGLIVPNIKDVQNKTIEDVARELVRLNVEMQNGKFREEDLAGGTFALSNIGSIGGTYASPLVMPPQVCIGALGRIRTEMKWSEKDMQSVPSKVMNISWSADHRIVDGATMANFNNHWKALVETPSRMLLHLK